MPGPRAAAIRRSGRSNDRRKDPRPVFEGDPSEPGLAVRRARLVAHFVAVLKDRQLYFADASVLFYMGPEQQFEARLDGGGEGDLAGELGWILGRHP
ncbi:MAG: hypothetical protein JO305_00805, partial [Alphaproteobacteria bacterium]|nr:hypothetical protein [Alphaproteobacteria bacterium]